jgi:hypothetical protein
LDAADNGLSSPLQHLLSHCQCCEFRSLGDCFGQLSHDLLSAPAVQENFRPEKNELPSKNRVMAHCGKGNAMLTFSLRFRQFTGLQVFVRVHEQSVQTFTGLK